MFQCWRKRGQTTTATNKSKNMDDRKARLAALAAKAGRTTITKPEKEDAATSTTAEQQQQMSQSSNIKFRNYTPQDARLEGEDETITTTRTSDEPDAKRVKTATTTAPADDSNKNRSEPSVLEQALAKAKAESGGATTAAANILENDLTAVAPKKINWDLKRDIQPKLDKLEKRTQRAIVEMLRERLEKEAAADEDDLD